MYPLYNLMSTYTIFKSFKFRVLTPCSVLSCLSINYWISVKGISILKSAGDRLMKIINVVINTR